MKLRTTKRHPNLVLLLILTALLLTPATSHAATSGTDERYFAETGHSVVGKFLHYWQDNGGLARFGYPISEEMDEVSPLDGKSYGVQYFERAEFEHHPENQPPYDVELVQLGTMRYKQEYPAGAPNQQANPNNPHTFAETDKTIGGAFRVYWEQHGQLTSFGYPISNEFQEVSDLNGKPYTVQYFERAEFELHPENQPPYDVLLSHLGEFHFKQFIESHTLTAIDMVSSAEGWAVGSGGLILRFHNGRWLVDASPVTDNSDLYSISIASKDEVWTNDGAVYRYRDGTWQEIKQERMAEEDVRAISMLSPEEGWAITNAADGYFLHYTAATGVWTIAQGPLFDFIFDIQMLSPNEGWAVGYHWFYHYKDGRWINVQKTLEPQDSYRISMVSPNDGWVISSGGDKMYHYNGQQWQALDSPVEGFWGIDMVSSNDGWAVGQGGRIVNYDGTGWHIYPSPTNNLLMGVKMVSSSEGWAVGAAGTILHYQNGTWNLYQW